jgi:hypothetical protein
MTFTDSYSKKHTSYYLVYSYDNGNREDCSTYYCELVKASSDKIYVMKKIYIYIDESSTPMFAARKMKLRVVK